jgi:hypothetical protein
LKGDSKLDQKVKQTMHRLTNLVWSITAIIAPIIGAISYEYLGYTESMRINMMGNGFLLVIFIIFGFYSQS